VARNSLRPIDKSLLRDVKNDLASFNAYRSAVHKATATRDRGHSDWNSFIAAWPTILATIFVGRWMIYFLNSFDDANGPRMRLISDTFDERSTGLGKRTFV
jgi:hypothetical protein